MDKPKRKMDKPKRKMDGLAAPTGTEEGEAAPKPPRGRGSQREESEKPKGTRSSQARARKLATQQAGAESGEGPWEKQEKERKSPAESAYQGKKKTRPRSSPPPPQDPRPPVQAPSAASGGVPEPTAAYLQQAALLPLPPRRSTPQPLLVVMDLNGTLLYRPNRRKAPRQIVVRPHTAQFLRYCIDTFWVVIWSSARPDTVDSICRQLLTPAQRQRLVAVWGRDRFGLTKADYDSRVQCYKRLSLLWASEEIARAYPGYAGSGAEAGSGSGASTHAGDAAPRPWSQANTVLIDDSFEKARSEPFNLLEIPEFNGDEPVSRQQPPILPQVHDYLNELCFQEDVSAYMRAHPFRATGSLPQGSDSNAHANNGDGNGSGDGGGSKTAPNR